MADRTGLGIIGFVFTGVTVAVMMVGVLVVSNHSTGKWTFDGVVTTSAQAAPVK